MEKKLKVHFVIPTLAGGGAERVMLAVASALTDRFSVTLVALNGTGELRGSIPTDLPFRDLHAARARDSIPALLRFIARDRPDVIISTMHATTAVFLARLFLRRKPKHIGRLTEPYARTAASLAPINRLLFRLALRSCSRIISISEGLIPGASHALGIPVDRFYRIYNPTDLALVREGAISPLAMQIAHPALVAAGRLVEQKGYVHMLDALKRMHTAGYAAKLYILGTGPLEPLLRKHAAGIGLTNFVHFVGFDANPWRYMASADVFVLSSLWEGFGNVLVEALEVGVPIVATDCESGPREVLADGKYGRLVPPGDPIALADALIALLRNPEEMARYRVSGQSRAREFALEAIAEQYARVIQDEAEQNL